MHRLGMANGQFSPSLYVRHRYQATPGATVFSASSTLSILQLDPFWKPKQFLSPVTFSGPLVQRGLNQRARLALSFSLSGHEAHIACLNLKTCVPFSFWLVNEPHAQKPDLVP